MGFWNTVGNMAAKGIQKANEVAEKKMGDYNDSYDKYSSRYSDMSNEQLKKELERLKRGTGGDHFERMGKMQAMKDEIENRRR